MIEHRCPRCGTPNERLRRAEAKLAQCVEALEDMVRVSGLSEPAVRRASCERAMAALAAAKGGE